MRIMTVGTVAGLTGVSVRKLHHYHHVGLVVPSVRTGAGYPGYTDADVERLHVVLVYRAAGLPLDKIRTLLDGEMYVADERFTRYYDGAAPGLAAYVRDLIVAAYP